VGRPSSHAPPPSSSAKICRKMWGSSLQVFPAAKDGPAPPRYSIVAAGKEEARRMTVPPTGKVIFLFTDIEGSTRLWERSPGAMSRALARHDEILRHAIEGHAGHVFKTVGDAFCAAFDSATEAVQAGLLAQRGLLAEVWPEEVGALRVRMALHTGNAEERGGDYFGPPVNRVARLLSAGHGGQTLLSLAAQELVRDGLPEGTELRDMGERHLKDLFRPERVFQLLAPDLPEGFPPLKTLDARRNNLPVQPTPLVGREREAGEVAGLLRREEVRLLTLVGPGGTGKTRLGLQVAADLVDEFEGGVFFVALAPVSDPGLVASTIAGPLGVIETPEQPLTESLKNYLSPREMLLLLDNFEQVVGAAPLVGELLSSCPKLRVLATSRAALRVYGEREYPVPPLTLPDPGKPSSPEILTRYEAVRLFVERAQAAKAGFALTEENAPAVAEICVRLDGLPLAIELAAARIRILPPEAMLARLVNRLKLLKGGARDLPERQRTLRGAIDWSHDLLDEEERTLFRRLSVFTGGRTLEAIEEVCDPEGELDALDGVESMVDKSLLRQEETDGEPRFVMLETIHEYAREKLEESGEAEEIKHSHAAYFLALAEEAEPKLKGHEQLEWLERLEAEHDNFRAALSWSLGGGDAELGLRLASALWWFWYVRGHLSEGRRWLEEALAKDGQAVASIQAMVLTGTGRIAFEQGDCEAATALLEESVTSFREAGHSQGLADAVGNLAVALSYQGQPERAKALFEESLSLYREASDRWGIAETLHGLGGIAEDQGELDQATMLYEESQKIKRELGDTRGIALCCNNLAFLTLLLGDLERAEVMLEELLRLARELGDKDLIASALEGYGYVALERGDPERAGAILRESVLMYQEIGIPRGILGVLVQLASVAVAWGARERAARLWGAVEALCEATGLSLSATVDPHYYERCRGARAELGEVAWEEALAEGRAMTLEESVAYALEADTDA
jgi:predicted ATPase/class 3 adenylate cyclase